VVSALGFTPISSGGSISGNAGTATSATSLNSSHHIAQTGSSGNFNTDFSNTPAGTLRYNGDSHAASNNPGGGWWLVQNMRHTNGSNLWGTQVAWGWEDNANRLRTRNVGGGNFGAWIEYLNSNNFNSWVPSLTGGGASGTWGINISGNAATAGGLAVNSTGTNNGANQIVRTDGNGYANFGWINTISGDNGLTGIGRIYASQDGYIRYYTPVNFEKVMLRAVFAREGGTLVAGVRYGIWTGGGPVSMSLPSYADSNNGDEITFNNLHQTWASHAFTVTCPASNVKINMLTENLVCNYNVGGFTLVCVWKDGSAAYWTVRT
jgi:hypothetical protein